MVAVAVAQGLASSIPVATPEGRVQLLDLAAAPDEARAFLAAIETLRRRIADARTYRGQQRMRALATIEACLAVESAERELETLVGDPAAVQPFIADMTQAHRPAVEEVLQRAGLLDHEPAPASRRSADGIAGSVPAPLSPR